METEDFLPKWDSQDQTDTPFPNNLAKIKVRGKPEEFQIKPTQQPQDSSETVRFSMSRNSVKGDHVLEMEAINARQDPE